MAVVQGFLVPATYMAHQWQRCLNSYKEAPPQDFVPNGSANHERAGLSLPVFSSEHLLLQV